MCELFGMSANRPTKLNASLKLFRKRGGETAHHRDGWGLAYTENGVFRLHKHPEAAASSSQLSVLADTVRTNLLVGHVRKAKHPLVNHYKNTHPFLRRCCDRDWVFAHNGLVADIMEGEQTRLQGNCLPNGDTDSEYAFNFLLEQIAARFRVYLLNGDDSWFHGLAELGGLLATYGQFNFLMSDGVYLIAYGHDRLHYLERRCDKQKVTLIATEPLTQTEPWQAFENGELRVYRNGNLVTRLSQPASMKTQATSARGNGISA